MRTLDSLSYKTFHTHLQDTASLCFKSLKTNCKGELSKSPLAVHTALSTGHGLLFKFMDQNSCSTLTCSRKSDTPLGTYPRGPQGWQLESTMVRVRGCVGTGHSSSERKRDNESQQPPPSTRPPFHQDLGVLPGRPSPSA